MQKDNMSRSSHIAIFCHFWCSHINQKLVYYFISSNHKLLSPPSVFCHNMRYENFLDFQAILDITKHLKWNFCWFPCKTTNRSTWFSEWRLTYAGSKFNYKFKRNVDFWSSGSSISDQMPFSTLPVTHKCWQVNQTVCYCNASTTSTTFLFRQSFPDIVLWRYYASEVFVIVLLFKPH